LAEVATMMAFLHEALGLAAQNLYVLPVHYVRDDGSCSCADPNCEHMGKHPDTAHGFKDATTDAKRIELWDRRSPQSNLGIATGPSRLVVIDADCKNGTPGLEEWARLVAELGGELEDTAMVRTQSGGLHVLYRAGQYEIPSSAGTLAPGIDVRAEGGFIVAPPSVGELGRYEWIEGHGLDRLHDLPSALAERLVGRAPRPSEPDTGLVLIPKGKRNAALTRLAGAMRRPGMQEDEILAALRLVNANRCSPPLADQEVVRIVTSVSAYEPETGSASAGGQALLTCLEDVEPEQVEFLWEARIVKAKLNMLFGEPGLGKSFLSLDCAARVSQGLPWPDGGSAPLGTVILLTAEDGLADTIRPRLDTLGADPARIHALTAVKRKGEGHEATFSLLDDLAILEAAVIRLEASLVIIDPLNAYLAKVDSHRAAEVRGALAPIAAMAERTGVTFLVVHHTNKGGDGRALNRATGSGDFVAAPRSVLLVAPDPEDESRRCLVSAKLNLARKPPGLGFSIVDGGIVFDDKPVTQDANQLLASVPRTDEESGRFEEAKAWLLNCLDDNSEHPQTEVKAEARAAGIKDRTLSRAKQALQVKSYKHGMGGGWYWSLPSPITSVLVRRKNGGTADRGGGA
jgi:hypothetical protein